MADGQQVSLTGGCLCGAVRYEAASKPLATVHCYCIDCRHSSGTSHCTHVVMPVPAFSLSGEVRHYDHPADSGNIVRRHFCPTCGSPLYSTNTEGGELVFLRASSLDDPDAITPQAQVYTSRAPRWHPVDPALPSFPEMPSSEQRQAMLEQG